MTRDNKNIGKRNNTMTQKLINKIGVEEVEKLWIQFGMYRAAEELSKLLNEYISSSTLRYMSQKYGWRRAINKKSPLFKGYLNGNVDPKTYKHLIFPEEMRNEKQ